MLIAQVVSFTVAVTVFVYLIGSTLASPVGQVILADEAAVTTVVPEATLNDDAGTTPVADEPTQTTGDSVTQRARQDEDEDDDDDDSTAAPVVTTRAPVIPPRQNESTILNEFNFAGQLLNPVNAKPKVPVPVDEEDETAIATEKSAGIDVEESEDNDRDNEITQDEVGTTAKVPTFESEYHFTVENFNKNVIKNKQREEQEGPGDDGARQGIPIRVNDVQTNDTGLSLTTLSPAELEKQSVSNYSENDNLEYSFQPLHDGEGRAGCECGKIPFKIPVDSESQINPTPWLAAVVRGGLFAGGRPHCAGTLVNNLYVLTSASCMDGLFPTSIQVWLTAHDSFEHHQASFGNIKMNVQEIIMHPNYERRSKNNDLCLLKLAHAVDISANSYFVPACLPAGSFNFAGSLAKVSGWSDGRAYRVCKADMPILDNNVCDRDTRHKGKITGNMVCAGYLTPTRVENCIGDAGGPLVSPNSGRATLVGVVSWGYEAKNRDYTPTVYTRVSEFSDWILHNTRDADWCGV